MSATRTVPPFRADHVGSLLRPPYLLQARQEHADHVIDDTRLHEIEDEAIRSVIRTQADIGLRTATDGEFRRASWHMDFIYQLGGVTRADDNMEVQFRNAEGTISFTPAALRVSERIRLNKTIFADAFTFLGQQPRHQQRPEQVVGAQVAGRSEDRGHGSGR